ncbi:MAG: hypothetical protein F6K50_45950 [Moorea sp. SIO3I7]|nr:hypothetical protein [Moorena sp. SIO3I7]
MKKIVTALTIVCIIIAQSFTNQVLADELPQFLAYQSPIGIVVEAKGNGKITRFNKSVISISKGEKLYRGDSLKIAKGSKVVIECYNNNKKWNIPQNTLVAVHNGCAPIQLPQVEVL